MFCAILRAYGKEILYKTVFLAKNEQMTKKEKLKWQTKRKELDSI
jgi:hypothetical protein